jgi:hypothetical protein
VLVDTEDMVSFTYWPLPLVDAELEEKASPVKGEKLYSVQEASMPELGLLSDTTAHASPVLVLVVLSRTSGQRTLR